MNASSSRAVLLLSLLAFSAACSQESFSDDGTATPSSPVNESNQTAAPGSPSPSRIGSAGLAGHDAMPAPAGGPVEVGASGQGGTGGRGAGSHESGGTRPTAGPAGGGSGGWISQEIAGRGGQGGHAGRGDAGQGGGGSGAAGEEGSGAAGEASGGAAGEGGSGAAGEASGGAAGGQGCSVAADCSVVSPCTVPVCQGGVCGVESVAKGVAVGGLGPGCQLPLCDGQGSVEWTQVPCPCTPGSVRCNEGNQPQTCAADGTWGPGAACPESAPVCSQGACTKVAQITTRSSNSCALLGDGRVRCWGADPIESGTKAWKPVPIEGIEGAVAVAAGDTHACAIDQIGAVRCWGENQWQQTGAEDDGFTAKPHLVDGLSGIKQLALGYGFTCALGGDGAVWCWGKRPASEVSEGLEKPLKMSLPPAMEIVAGWRHACAKTVDGDAYCWGSGELGQLGTSKVNDSVNPVLTGPIGDLSLSAGDDVTCAAGPDALRCWGFLQATFPTAGLGVNPLPLLLKYPENPFAAVAIGQDFACLWAVAGPVVCQGNGSQMQFGVAPPVELVHGLATVPLTGSVTSLVAGGSHACALLSSGAVVCWGQNTDGQLGIGVDDQVAPPTAVAW